MTTNKMLSRIENGVGYITFNNPEKHNAVSIEMWDALERILDDFRSDNTVRVIVLNGAGGKSFVSGADISKFDKERSSKEAVLSYNKRTQKVYENLETFPKPTIAMINGYCIGGGLNLAVCCDIRICSEKSKFAMPAAKLSLGYPFSSIKRLFDVMFANAFCKNPPVLVSNSFTTAGIFLFCSSFCIFNEPSALSVPSPNFNLARFCSLIKNMI